jgi:hypothetical protein
MCLKTVSVCTIYNFQKQWTGYSALETKKTMQQNKAKCHYHFEYTTSWQLQKKLKRIPNVCLGNTRKTHLLRFFVLKGRFGLYSCILFTKKMDKWSVSWGLFSAQVLLQAKRPRSFSSVLLHCNLKITHCSCLPPFRNGVMEKVGSTQPCSSLLIVWHVLTWTCNRTSGFKSC